MSWRAALLGAALAGLPACHPSFDVTETGQATIAASPLPISAIPVSFPSFLALDLSSSQEFKNQGITKNEIQSVKLTSAKVAISSPSGATFGFLDSLAFEVSAQGQPQATVASISNIPSDATTLDLTVADVELAPYVTASSMSVTTDATGMPPPQDTTVTATLVFDVVPKIP